MITPIPAVNSRWKNRDNGSVYVVCVVTNLSANDEENWPITVVFCNELSDRWYSHPQASWADHFERADQ